MPSASSLFEVSGNQLIKLIKPVTSLVLKKRKVTTIVGVFQRKSADKKTTKITEIMFYWKNQIMRFLSDANKVGLEQYCNSRERKVGVLPTNIRSFEPANRSIQCINYNS